MSCLRELGSLVQNCYHRVFLWERGSSAKMLARQLSAAPE